MSEVLKSFIEFVIFFILVFVAYKIVYRKKKELNDFKDNSEIRNFVLKYDLDVRKIDFKKLLNVMIVINSFIISFTAAIIVRIESFMWSILVCVVIIIALMYALFELAGRYFKKEEAKYKEKTVEKAVKEVVRSTKKKTNRGKKVNKNV